MYGPLTPHKFCEGFHLIPQRFKNEGPPPKPHRNEVPRLKPNVSLILSSFYVFYVHN